MPGRRSATAYRPFAVYVAGFIVQGSVMFLVQLAGESNEAKGWQMATAAVRPELVSTRMMEGRT